MGDMQRGKSKRLRGATSQPMNEGWIVHVDIEGTMGLRVEKRYEKRYCAVLEKRSILE